MRKSIPVKYLLLADILLASGMAGWELLSTNQLVSALIVLLSVLIAASPLAYAVCSPVVLYFAKQNAEKENIAVGRPSALSRLCKIDTLVVGKSGTITEGDPFITDLIPEGLLQSTLLSLAASAEEGSRHPIARVICRTAAERDIRVYPASAFNEIPGCGVEALMNGTSLRVGRTKWLQENKARISANLLTKVDQLACRGKIPLIVCEGKNAKGIIALEDPIEPAIPSTVRRLAKLGIGTIMLTGDSQRTASAIAKSASLAAARANLTPAGKAREVQLMRTRGCTIAMAGIPELDEEAFAEADLSIVLGKPPKEIIGDVSTMNLMDIKDEEDMGELEKNELQIRRELSEMRIEKGMAALKERKADILLPQGLPQILVILDIAKRAQELILQNRRIAYLTWLLLIPPATGLLTIFEDPLLLPLTAFAGMLAATLLIIGNSLRMRSG
ncbi:MAG: cation-translocating P-type ATPase [Selenomonadaceae bacterium]|nr:cation-translocating P-type ATPase [Selenomonadaceae bacterium]